MNTFKFYSLALLLGSTLAMPAACAACPGFVECPLYNAAEITSTLHTQASSGHSLSEPLQKFSRIQVGPLVNVVLQKGNAEHVRIDYEGITADKINYIVKGKTLHLYLDDARYTVKHEKVINDGIRQHVPIYTGVTITAYITYTDLESIQFRGEENLSCSDSLRSDKFKLKVFGQSTVDLAYVQSRRLKVHSYGENRIAINSGDASLQKYRLYGENKIDSEFLAGDRIKTSSFGENQLKLAASQRLNLMSFGTVRIEHSGNPQFKRFVLGDSYIDQK